MTPSPENNPLLETLRKRFLDEQRAKAEAPLLAHKKAADQEAAVQAEARALSEFSGRRRANSA